MPLLKGQQAVADHYGCDARNVRYWLSNYTDFPKPVNGVYDTDKIDAWQANQPQMLLRSGGKMDGAGGDLAKANSALTVQLKQQKVEQAKEAALKARREREVYEGTLLPRRAWETFAALLLSELGDWCDQLPELAAQQVPKKHQAKMRQWLEEQLNTRRAQLAEDLKRTPEDKGP